MTRTVAIVQARTGSTRLPGKVLMPLAGESVLARVMERARRARLVDDVVVATTVDPADDAIVALAGREGWAVERGSVDDLLDRYAVAARRHAADTIVRITSDCPLLDPAVVDATIEGFRAAGADYASSALPPQTYPRGLDVEVVSRDALERAWREDDRPDWREHVTPYLYRHPELFRLLRVPGPEDHSGLRWCIDTPEDYELVRRIYDVLGNQVFGWRDVLAVVDANPSWSSLNGGVVQKVVAT